MCAKIIGGLRNNNLESAGIAGGNYIGATDFSDKGVLLYGFSIYKEDANDTPYVELPINYLADAIVTSAIFDPTVSYGFGIHVANHSWKLSEEYQSDTNVLLLTEAVHFANRAQVTQCVARGNVGTNTTYYPAIIDDDWILSVGGTGIDGNYSHTDQSIVDNSPANSTIDASWGSNIDVSGPASGDVVDMGPGYYCNGTSFATPHVTGTVALLQGYLNDTLPAYGNLSPEDCERIIELSSTDINASGYDSLTGFGRLNIGKALRLVEKPWRSLRHFGTNGLFPYSISPIPWSTNDTVTLTERCQNGAGMWFNKKKYIVDTYRVTAVVTHTLDVNDSIIAYWPRHSSSTLFQHFDTVNMQILPRQRIVIDSISNSHCFLMGYLYHVYDTSGTDLGWLPDSILNLEYSVLTKSKLAPNVQSITSTQNFTVNISPNPASRFQTITVQGTEETDINVDLYTATGERLWKVFSGRNTSGGTEVHSDISILPPSVYFYRVSVGEHCTNARFIKQ